MNVNMPKRGIMKFPGYVATEKGVTDRHAAANYTSTQLSRAGKHQIYRSSVA